MSEAGFRSLPSVDRVVRELAGDDLPTPVVADVARRTLAELRRGIAAGGAAPDVWPMLRDAVDAVRRSRLRPVINGTGVLLHTNLGRSPLSKQVAAEVAAVAAGYCNLEIDLSTGERGKRAPYVERCLASMCDAEAAVVVNNCAAALVLLIRGYVSPPRDEVIMSRGELVQIGGGFRVPDILAAAGAKLREIGTTNVTTTEDYAAAASGRSAMILRVHRSNFCMDGFASSPTIDQIVAVGERLGIPVVDDLGSGATDGDTWTTGDAKSSTEPTANQLLAAGVDAVCFSGDKLLGGPQAGVIVGRSDRLTKLRSDPMLRALRCDKLVLAALQATVEARLRSGSAGTAVGQMAATSVESLRGRAEFIVCTIGDRLGPGAVTIEPSEATTGGGTLPGAVIESVAIRFRPDGISDIELARRLRCADPPVVATVRQDAVCVDLRTVLPTQDREIVAAVLRACRT